MKLALYFLFIFFLLCCSPTKEINQKNENVVKRKFLKISSATKYPSFVGLLTNEFPQKQIESPRVTHFYGEPGLSINLWWQTFTVEFFFKRTELEVRRGHNHLDLVNHFPEILFYSGSIKNASEEFPLLQKIWSLRRIQVIEL